MLRQICGTSEWGEIPSHWFRVTCLVLGIDKTTGWFSLIPVFKWSFPIPQPTMKMIDSLSNHLNCQAKLRLWRDDHCRKSSKGKQIKKTQTNPWVIKDTEMLEMAHYPPFLHFIISWKCFSDHALLIVYEIFLKRWILHKTRSFPIPFLVIVTVRDKKCLIVQCLSWRWEGKRMALGWTEVELFTAPLFHYQRAIMLQLPSASYPQTAHPPPCTAKAGAQEMSPLLSSSLWLLFLNTTEHACLF